MSGGTPGVDYYNLPGVHWVTWFKGGGYSIHEAYWRSSFGGQDYLWNGSHGCVNSPYAVAQFIFDWAPVGTPVIVHY
jgi:lipoprotein-anchoring transpeptidase ErfK/SrfK